MSRDWLEHDAGDDWLDDADSRYVGVIEAAENARRIADERAVADIRSNLPALIPAATVADELPVEDAKRSELFANSWSSLDEEQRVFLLLLKEKRYNIAATCRTYVSSGRTFSIGIYRRWLSDDADFVFVLKVMKSVAVRESVNKERLLLRAEEIADEALEPTPILHKGLPTGFYENHKDVALRANEQLMKATGLLREGQQSTRVTVRLVNLAGPETDVIEGEAEVIDDMPIHPVHG